MSSEAFILAAGCAMFAITTLAALWTGYLLMQKNWVAENAELTDSDDRIRPLFNPTYPEQQEGHRQADAAVSEGPIKQ